MKIRYLAAFAALLVFSAAPSSASDLSELAQKTFVNPNAGHTSFAGTKEAGSITMGISTMDVMDPHKLTYSDEMTVAGHCFDALVAFNAANEIVPAAAESWEDIDSGIRWRFKLRPAKWVDSAGREIADVTADDFIFAWSRLLDPANGSAYWHMASIFKNAEAYREYKSGAKWARAVDISEVGFKAVDATTIEIELEHPTPDLFQYLRFIAMAPINRAFFDSVGESAYGTAHDKMLYNGAFRMSGWKLESSIDLTKNGSWRDASSVELEKIRFAKYADRGATMNAFVDGDADIVAVAGEQRRAFASDGITLSTFESGYCGFFFCNTLSNGPSERYPNAKFSDVRSANLRRAISLAVDREAIIKAALNNGSVAAKTMAPGVYASDRSNFSDAVIKENGGKPLYLPKSSPDDAIRYLNDALRDLGYGDKKEISISILAIEGTEGAIAANAVQEQLRSTLDIDVRVNIMSAAVARARLSAINYDLFAGGWSPDFNDPSSALGILMTDDGNNYTGYANATFDRFVIEGGKMPYGTDRDADLARAEILVAGDLPIIPLYWRHDDFAMSGKIASGVVRGPFQNHSLTYVRLFK